MRRYASTGALALLFAAAWALAAEPDPREFLSRAAQAGMTEVKLGKLAAKSKDEQIREFGERMVHDHSVANERLEAFAASQQLYVPKLLDKEHQSMVDKLSRLSGEEFDAAYSEHMVMNHTRSLSLFEAAATSSDPDLASFARYQLPVLQAHKRKADSLHSEQRLAAAETTGTVGR